MRAQSVSKSGSRQGSFSFTRAEPLGIVVARHRGGGNARDAAACLAPALEVEGEGRAHATGLSIENRVR